MTNPTAFASTLGDLSRQLEAFCQQHKLPYLSADELLCELYSEEVRRQDICEWLEHFIDAWDAVSDAEADAYRMSKEAQGGTRV